MFALSSDDCKSFLTDIIRFFVFVGYARLQLHDEAQGVVRRQGAEGLSRKRVVCPSSVTACPCAAVVAMHVRADGVAGIGDSVSRGVTSFQAVPAGAAFRI